MKYIVKLESQFNSSTITFSRLLEPNYDINKGRIVGETDHNPAILIGFNINDIVSLEVIKSTA